MLHSTAQEPLSDGKSFDFATRISKIDTMLRPKCLVVRHRAHSTHINILLIMM